MHKNILTVVGITILFLGLAIQPSIAVQPEKIDVEPNVDDVEGLVAELRIVINEILQEYRYNPMVSYLCNYILGILHSPIERLYCYLLLILFFPAMGLLLLLAGFFYTGIIRSYYLGLTVVRILGLWALTLDFTCSKYFFWRKIQPLRIISTLTGLDECPCMQQ